MSDPASSSTETPHGTGLLPRDFSADELAAATALHLQAPLVTADHVVDDVPGLSVLPSAGT